jgi:hypothetical protein
MREHLREYELGQITPVEERLTQAGYKLLTNVIDPANRESLILYQIPEAGDVVIEVYNSQGQKLTSINKRHITGGKFSLDLNNRNFSNGLYLIALKVNDFYEVKKMILIK